MTSGSAGLGSRLHDRRDGRSGVGNHAWIGCKGGHVGALTGRAGAFEWSEAQSGCGANQARGLLDSRRQI